MGETENCEKTTEGKREQVVEVVNKAEKVKERDDSYPADGHAIIAYFASSTYVRKNGCYVLKENSNNDKRDF